LDMEVIFWKRHYLSASEYLRTSGVLEQMVLDGMRRLRSVLDMLPYRAMAWVTLSDADQSAPLVRAERLVFKLWRQFFIVGAFYSAVLKNQHVSALVSPLDETGEQLRARLSSIVGIAIFSEEAEQYRHRWRLWCNAVRFRQLAQQGMEIGVTSPSQNLPSLLPRPMVIGFMLQACAESTIHEIWDLRRDAGQREDKPS
jgi:hypothetical protein